MLSMICNGRLVDSRTLNGDYLNILIEDGIIVELLPPDSPIPK